MYYILVALVGVWLSWELVSSMWGTVGSNSTCKKQKLQSGRECVLVCLGALPKPVSYSGLSPLLIPLFCTLALLNTLHTVYVLVRALMQVWLLCLKTGNRKGASVKENWPR